MKDDAIRERAREFVRDVLRAEEHVRVSEHSNVTQTQDGVTFVEAVIELPAVVLDGEGEPNTEGC